MSTTRRTVSLPPVLENVIANAPAGPRLLDSLTITTSAGTTATEIDTPVDAAEGLRQARIWLWQNPDQVQAIHLRLGAEIGVAVSRRAHATAGPVVLRAWSRAAGFASDIEGTAPTEPPTSRTASPRSWSGPMTPRRTTTRSAT